LIRIASVLRAAATIALLAVVGCAAEPAPTTEVSPEVFRSSARYQREYVLQPGDQIQVSVFHAPELATTTVVRPDGYVSLPILKDVKLAGLIVPDADRLLERLYSQRMVKPDVTVAVMTPRQAQVYVLGEVARPGPVALRDASTLSLALANAGGVTRTASLEAVAVVRLEDDGHLTGTVMPTAQSGETAFYQVGATTLLRSGDLVIVPESGRSQFVRFIQDYVNTPANAVTNVLAPYTQYEDVSVLEQIVK
jgi:polysaccharide export outer membrane protein